MKPGGRTAFFTIYVPNSVPRAIRRQALDAAPKYGWSRAAPTQLMQSAGFVDIDETDYTAAYETTLRAWHDKTTERAEELEALWGRQLFAERQADWRAAIEAVEAGWQRRVLISATRTYRTGSSTRPSQSDSRTSTHQRQSPPFGDQRFE